MAVQNHLLSNTILIRSDDGDDSDSSLQGETLKVEVNIPFKYPYLRTCGLCTVMMNNSLCFLYFVVLLKYD